MHSKLCGRPPQYVPAPCKLTSDFLTLKVVSESTVTCMGYLCTNFSHIFILSYFSPVLELGPMYAIDVRRQTKASLNASVH